MLAVVVPVFVTETTDAVLVVPCRVVGKVIDVTLSSGLVEHLPFPTARQFVQ
jgi:hypothetical protein